MPIYFSLYLSARHSQAEILSLTYMETIKRLSLSLQTTVDMIIVHETCVNPVGLVWPTVFVTPLIFLDDSRHF